MATKNCWQNYVDYYKCIDAKGASFGPCRQFRKVFTSLCPTKWVENWDEQREKGTFPAFYKDPTRGTAHGSGDDHGAAGGHH
ncbi:Cytochrome c oxidase subunit 6B [Irineochytrium annulatum]|nr:Cytochrome c oxidase subunit 6B [Irineochytrium annulatum]